MGDDLFEQLIKALGGRRRYEIVESQDESSTEPDVFDFRRPGSLDELMALLNQDVDPDAQDQMDEAREKRVMAMIYVLGVAGITASALTGNVAILAVILVFLYRLFRTLP